MLYLKFDQKNPEFGALAAINLSFMSGKRVWCYALGCDSKIARRYSFMTEFLGSSALSIRTRVFRFAEDAECIDVVEDYLREQVGHGIQADADISETNQFAQLSMALIREIRVEQNSKEKAMLRDVARYSYLNINLVVRKNGETVFVVQGQSAASEIPIILLKEILQNDQDLLLTFA